jgi:hypothetical protein
MARTVGYFTFGIILLWSLLSLGAWAVFSLGGDLVFRQFDWMFGGNPDVVPVAGAIFRFFQTLGIGLVFVVWALGSLAVWLVGTLMRRLVESMTVIQVRERAWSDTYEQRPMKDVTPPHPSRILPPGRT